MEGTLVVLILLAPWSVLAVLLLGGLSGRLQLRKAAVRSR